MPSLFLRECLDSVRGQSLREIQIVAINDGSTEHFLDILKEYAAKDSRITVLDQENQGAGISRNNGMRAATGEFVAFMDPDDWYPDLDILETLYSAAKEHQVRICGGSMSAWQDGKPVVKFSGVLKSYTFDRDGRMDYRDYQFDYGYTRFIYELSMLRENQIAFPSYQRFQDPPFFVAAMICAREFYSLQKTTYCYRQGHADIAWTAAKAMDYVRGLSDNLVISNQHGLAKLHHLTYSRLVASWPLKKILAHMNADHPEISQILIRAIGRLDMALLQQVDPALQASQVVTRLHEAIRKIEKDGKRGNAGPSAGSAPEVNVERMCEALGRMDGVCRPETMPSSVFAAFAILCDDASIVPVCVAITSLIRTKNSGSRYSISVVDAGLGEDSRRKLLSFREADGIRLDLIDNPDGKPGASSEGGDIAAGRAPVFQQLKCRLPALLAGLDRVILLDSETLVRRDLCALYAMPIGNAVRGAVPDFQAIFRESGEGASFEYHYDDAVLLLNLQAMREHSDGASFLADPAVSPGPSPDSAAAAGGVVQAIPLVFNMANRSCFVDGELRILGQVNQCSGHSYQTLQQFFDDIHVVTYRSASKPWETVAAMYSDEWWACYYASPCHEAIELAADHPKVSLVIPVYNVEPYLRKCLDSAVNQSLRDIEIICVNDGSTDGSPEDRAGICEPRRADPRRHADQRGIIRRTECGDENRDGEYLAFLDSDDALDLSAMTELYGEAVRERSGCAVFRWGDDLRKHVSRGPIQPFPICPEASLSHALGGGADAGRIHRQRRL